MRNSLNKVKWRENYNITHLKCSHKVVRWCLQEAALSQGVACKGFIMKGFSEGTPKGVGETKEETGVDQAKVQFYPNTA